MNNGKQLPNTKKGGFTVIEVIVALLLISIIMIPLLNSYIFFNKSSTRASNETNILTSAQDILEEMKSKKALEDGTIERDPYQVEITTTSRDSVAGVVYMKNIQIIDKNTGKIVLQTERAK